MPNASTFISPHIISDDISTFGGSCVFQSDLQTNCGSVDKSPHQYAHNLESNRYAHTAPIAYSNSPASNPVAYKSADVGSTNFVSGAGNVNHHTDTAG